MVAAGVCATGNVIHPMERARRRFITLRIRTAGTLGNRDLAVAVERCTVIPRAAKVYTSIGCRVGLVGPFPTARSDSRAYYRQASFYANGPLTLLWQRAHEKVLE